MCWRDVMEGLRNRRFFTMTGQSRHLPWDAWSQNKTYYVSRNSACWDILPWVFHLWVVHISVILGSMIYDHDQIQVFFLPLWISCWHLSPPTEAQIHSICTPWNINVKIQSLWSYEPTGFQSQSSLTWVWNAQLAQSISVTRGGFGRILVVSEQLLPHCGPFFCYDMKALLVQWLTCQDGVTKESVGGHERVMLQVNIVTACVACGWRLLSYRWRRVSS